MEAAREPKSRRAEEPKSRICSGTCSAGEVSLTSDSSLSSFCRYLSRKKRWERVSRYEYDSQAMSTHMARLQRLHFGWAARGKPGDWRLETVDQKERCINAMWEDTYSEMI